MLTEKTLQFKMLMFNPQQLNQLPKAGTQSIQSGFPLSGALNIISKKKRKTLLLAPLPVSVLYQ